MTIKPRILNSEPENYCDEARSILKEFSNLTEAPLTRRELLDRIGDFDALIVRLSHKVDEELLENGSSLKAVITATTGLDHIDLNSAKEHSITVLSLKGERNFLDTITATAEHAWALLLALVRHIPAAHKSVLQGEWDRNSFRGAELRGKQLGVIGLGRLGTMVARYGIAFQMKVTACDPSPLSIPDGVSITSLESLLSNSDIISIHVPLDDSTTGMLGKTQLALVKPSTVLINTSRGEIINETALLEALESGAVAGAALDVLCGETAQNSEWINNNPLVRYAASNDNLILSPHIGGATSDSMKSTEVFMAKKLKSFFE